MTAKEIAEKPVAERTFRESLAYVIYVEKLRSIAKPKALHPRDAAKDAVIEANYLIEELAKGSE